MKKSTRTISRVSAVSLALIIALSSLVTAFGATMSGGNRGTDYFGVVWKQPVPFSYTDALGNQIDSELGPIIYSYDDTSSNYNNLGPAVVRGYFNVHFFAQNGQTLSKYAYNQRAFCIEPEKCIEGGIINNTNTNDNIIRANDYHYDSTGIADYTSAMGLQAYDSRLQPEKKKLLNYVLANGYGNYVPADAAHVAYWYATQLLVYEVVAGKRDGDFNAPVSSFNPTDCLEAETGAETTVAAIQQAYNNIVGWVKMTLKNPAGTSENTSDMPVNSMVYSNALGKYYYDYSFNDIIRQDLFNTSSYAVKLSELNLKESDIIVYDQNSSVKVSYTIDKANKRIRFTSDEPLSESVVIGFMNPRIRGINESLKSTANSGLMLIDMSHSKFQTFARGCAKLVNRPAYFKLNTSDTVRLEMNIESSNAEFVANNSNYSLEGAVYGVYSDLNCQNLIGTMTTDENGKAVYNSGQELPNKNMWARALTPSKGYLADKEVHRFVNTGKSENGVPVFAITSKQVPKHIPLYIALDSQGLPASVNLIGSIIRVDFYGDMYSSPEELKNVKPLRSWAFESDFYGYMDYDEDHFISEEYDEYLGDEMYYFDGKPCLPLGTITIQQICPPIGYEFKLNETTYVAQVTDFMDLYIDLEPVEHDEPKVIIGDVNNDGSIDVLDAVKILNYTVDKVTLTENQLYVADVNDDGSIDALDALDILNFAVGKITEFQKKA